MLIKDLKCKIEAGAFVQLFGKLYGDDARELAVQQKRYMAAVTAFENLYPERADVRIFSASGSIIQILSFVIHCFRRRSSRSDS